MKNFFFAFILSFTLPCIYAQDILVLLGGATSQLSSAQGYAADLSATGVFNSVDAVVWDAPNKYDVNYLNAYDAIMVVTNGGYNASNGMGSVLKTYVDNGGGVGIFLFANASIPIGGAWDYHALLPGGQSMGPTTFGTIDIPTHPALNYPFDINTSSWNVGSLWSSTSTTLSPEAYSIAKFSDGRPALQARENVGVNSTGRVIDFAVFPSAASGGNKIQGYQLFANIMMWLTGSIEVTGSKCLSTNSLSFSYVDSGSSPIVSYNWDFGDTTSSTDAMPNKTYMAAGEYIITMMVVRQDASSQTRIERIVISEDPSTADAGEDKYLLSGTTIAQLTGNVPTVGEGIWSFISGPNSPNTSATNNVLDLSNLITGAYEYQWEISNSDCPPSIDLVKIVIADNSAPTDIAITAMEIVENNTIGDAIGVFSTTDADNGNTHTYSLVSGTGDEGNGSFTISDTALQASTSFDFETKAFYSIRVRVTDNFGGFFERSFQIEILNTDNEDTDGDGTPDSEDAFPLDPNEDTDTDSDGTGDNADTDDDNDGTPDLTDDFPLDPNEDTDTDNDGTGDNADTDDDNDGTPDLTDDFPLDPNEDTDTDNDGTGDNADTDDDNDGTPDSEDAFPLDLTEDTDTDNDGIGDNADTDDDGDGTPDSEDAFPLDSNEDTDTDNDGTGDNADTDDDNDGTPDSEDAFPLDLTEDTDTDNDGIGDNADTDDDGDGTPDSEDAFPLDPNEDTDTDGDGTGDNEDMDGIIDDNDSFPKNAEPTLVAAEAFTPNGDGINDGWIIPGIENYPNSVVTVYNRWGHEVFAAIGYKNDWEGMYRSNSNKLPPGSYLYVIDLHNGTAPLKGWLFINY